MNPALADTPDAPPVATPRRAGRPAPRGGRRLLGLLFLLFALPFATAAGLYYGDWRPANGGNYGELLTAASPLDYSRLLGSDGRESSNGLSAPAATLTGRWTLLVAAAGHCAANCRGQLDLTRRLHVALNKNMPRLKRLLLTADPDRHTAALHASWPDLVVASSADAAWQALLPAGPADSTRVYLLDPAGRPVLRFPADFDGRRALRDLDRLLKLSRLG